MVRAVRAERSAFDAPGVTLLIDVKRPLKPFYDELFVYDGSGEPRLKRRILKCGKQYRYVLISYRPNAAIF